MDRDTAELIAHLAARLGMVLEDAAPVALALGARNDLALAYLGEAIANAAALHAAITALAS